MYIKAIQVQLSTRKMRRHPIFVVDSNSLSIDLRLLSCPNLALKPLYLVGTVGRSHSMLRGTLIIWHARAISCFLSACTKSKAQLNIELITSALTWCGNIFVGCSMSQPFHAGHGRHQNCRVRCVQHFWAREVGRLGSNNIFRALSRSAVFYEA